MQRRVPRFFFSLFFFVPEIMGIPSLFLAPLLSCGCGFSSQQLGFIHGQLQLIRAIVVESFFALFFLIFLRVILVKEECFTCYALLIFLLPLNFPDFSDVFPTTYLPFLFLFSCFH